MAATGVMMALTVCDILLAGALSGGALTVDQELQDLLALYGGLYFIIYLGVAIVSAVWIYRVSANAHTLAYGLTISPAWAVGWYFVPVANLWKPFQGLNEAWRASVATHAWRTEATPGLLRWWWGLWLGTNVLSTVVSRMPADGDGYYQMSIVSGAAELILDVVFILVIRRLTAAQIQSRRQDVFD